MLGEGIRSTVAHAKKDHPLDHAHSATSTPTGEAEGGPAPPTAGCESMGDDAARERAAKSPTREPIVASVQSGATKGRVPSAPAVDPGACEGGPAP
jgi:hypothetical protein